MLRRTCFLWLALACAAATPDGFVLVSGPEVDPFEICDHPVTNAEYKVFVDATGHRAPRHWLAGRIPAGMESHPVIFVNRFDATDYLAWRTKKESRIYRLPTTSEYDLAQRAGKADERYSWGTYGSPHGRADFDELRNRTAGEWRKYSKPVKSYPANAFGVYDLQGSVWQMVDRYPDPATMQYKYRVENPVEEENGVAGGSWAHGMAYLENGVRGGVSAGATLPDVGFRIVREPAGSQHFRRVVRRVIASPAGNGAIFVGWQSLPGDSKNAGFHVYRSKRRDIAGERITQQPVTTGTSFLDTSAPKEGRAYYRVRMGEGPPSEWAGVNTSAQRTPAVMTFEASEKNTSVVPVFGDLDGDGVLDAVLRLDNGIKEMSRDPGRPVELEAFTSYGRALWRKQLVWHDHCFGNANNVPVVVYDLDGDGKAEVIVRLQEGDEVYLAVLDGMTGRVIRAKPWTKMVSDFSKSSTRIHTAIAYLDGVHPAIITQTGLYENEVFDAYDADLKKLWTFESFGETNGSGSHHIEIADVNGDGKDEIFDGTTLLNSDGTVRWSQYLMHPDIVQVKHVIPDRKGRQVFYAVETTHTAGAYLVDADTGKMIWKINGEYDPRWKHAHVGWTANLSDKWPGMESMTNRDGHLAEDGVLITSEGTPVINPWPKGYWPVNWLGGTERQLINGDASVISRLEFIQVQALQSNPAPKGKGGSCRMVADLVGDFRDEIVCVEGNKVVVYTNLDPVAERQKTRVSSREYRLWMARNWAAGYPTYFEFDE